MSKSKKHFWIGFVLVNMIILLAILYWTPSPSTWSEWSKALYVLYAFAVGTIAEMLANTARKKQVT